MLSRRRFITITSALLTFYPCCFGQFSSFFVDAPTRRATSLAQAGTLEGFMIETEPGQKADGKIVNITFIFTKLPTVFFDSYDNEKKRLVLDFYDTQIGESLLDTLQEFPITTSWVENAQIDLNKDVAGLRPDFRDVVKISLFSEYNFPYDIEEKFGVIVLSFPWNKAIKRKSSRRKRSVYWKIPLVLGASAGIFYYVYNEHLLKPGESEDPLIDNVLKDDYERPPRPLFNLP